MLSLAPWFGCAPCKVRPEDGPIDETRFEGPMRRLEAHRFDPVALREARHVGVYMIRRGGELVGFERAPEIRVGLAPESRPDSEVTVIGLDEHGARVFEHGVGDPRWIRLQVEGSGEKRARRPAPDGIVTLAIPIDARVTRLSIGPREGRRITVPMPQPVPAEAKPDPGRRVK